MAITTAEAFDMVVGQIEEEIDEQILESDDWDNIHIELGWDCNPVDQRELSAIYNRAGWKVTWSSPGNLLLESTIV